MLRKLLIFFSLMFLAQTCFCWGFFGHRRINNYAVFLLPPELIRFYKPHITYLADHAVDLDMRRYAVAEEGPRHYIDLNEYGVAPFPDLPRNWDSAVAKFGADTVNKRGIVPWWVQVMQGRLTKAFKEKDGARILKLSAEIGHYIADAHVPLHAHSNHNGQHTNQRGIHGFWESRVPELLADKDWDFFIGKATYIANKSAFIWDRVLESAVAADTVLQAERELTAAFPADQKYAFEQRGNNTIRQYSSAFSKAYDKKLAGMVERRMRQSIFAVASFWYTAWVDAGQPNLSGLNNIMPSLEEQKEWEALQQAWRNGAAKGREHE